MLIDFHLNLKTYRSATSRLVKYLFFIGIAGFPLLPVNLANCQTLKGLIQIKQYFPLFEVLLNLFKTFKVFKLCLEKGLLRKLIIFFSNLIYFFKIYSS